MQRAVAALPPEGKTHGRYRLIPKVKREESSRGT
jgi:hypothetical protein